MESPALNWIQSNAGKLLAYDVVHEVAHEWFYSTVGNDQALDPFADEAVAEFLSREVAGNSWSSTRCPGRNLDRSIYTTPGSCYVPVVYYQGYRYLKDYRDQVGAADFWQGMQNYYAANRFGIGSTRKLLDALDAASNYHPNHAARFPSLYP
jgi:aminopeptidase N